MEPSGPVAQDIADLTAVLVVLGAAVFVAFVVLLALAVHRSMRSTGSTNHVDRTRTDATPSLGSPLARRLVVGGGVILPVVVVAIVFGWTLETMRDIPRAAPDDALRIDVTARQWQWDITHSGTGIIEENVIHVPVGRVVELRMDSIDVIHSLWVPQLAGKVDVLPDHTNSLIFTADEPGEFRGQCAEFCGLGHSGMELRVVALEQDDWRQWVAERDR